jgi:hypothetical protein
MLAAAFDLAVRVPIDGSVAILFAAVFFDEWRRARTGQIGLAGRVHPVVLGFLSLAWLGFDIPIVEREVVAHAVGVAGKHQ